MTQPRPERLDVLFIGAHPDDESGLLAAFGRWRHECGVKVGVVSITRGEGGGNAVGSEDGPLLGLLREREERSALSLVGVERFFYLDKVDFYYTVSAPLTARVWGHLDTRPTRSRSKDSSRGRCHGSSWTLSAGSAPLVRTQPWCLNRLMPAPFTRCGKGPLTMPV